MITCEKCKKRRASYIVYDTKYKSWVFNCEQCIVAGKDLVVPPHMIDRLKES